MRYCPVCLTIYETDGNVCAPCNEKTIDIGYETNQVPLFPPSEEDKVRSVYRTLKEAYSEALEAVRKAEKKLREAQAELISAGSVLLDYDAVIKGKNIKGLPPYLGEDEYKIITIDLPEEVVEKYVKSIELDEKMVDVTPDCEIVESDIDLIGIGTGE